MDKVVLVLDNVRSAHNVGAIMRTAAALGLKEILAVGNTPYPRQPDDHRLPHVAERAERQIGKTSLGAEHVVKLTPISDVVMLKRELDRRKLDLIVIDNVAGAKPLPDFSWDGRPVALVVGHEIDGVNPKLNSQAAAILAIPMSEAKESLNVAAAAAMALYHFRFKA